MLERLRAQARPSTPGEFWDVFMQEFKAEHLDEEIVFLYDKYFTQDEIREFVRFYETPAGQKLAATGPQLAQDAMQRALSRASLLAQRVVERLRAAGYLKSAPKP
jgi:uncharacterized protein